MRFSKKICLELLVVVLSSRAGAAKANFLEVSHRRGVTTKGVVPYAVARVPPRACQDEAWIFSEGHLHTCDVKFNGCSQRCFDHPTALSLKNVAPVLPTAEKFWALASKDDKTWLVEASLENSTFHQVAEIPGFQGRSTAAVLRDGRVFFYSLAAGGLVFTATTTGQLTKKPDFHAVEFRSSHWNASSITAATVKANPADPTTLVGIFALKNAGLAVAKSSDGRHWSDLVPIIDTDNDIPLDGLFESQESLFFYVHHDNRVLRYSINAKALSSRVPLPAGTAKVEDRVSADDFDFLFSKAAGDDDVVSPQESFAQKQLRRRRKVQRKVLTLEWLLLRLTAVALIELAIVLGCIYGIK